MSEAFFIYPGPIEIGRMASLGHEESDASNYANWTVDYLKVFIYTCLLRMETCR
jgi:hypothetical protein